jgi:transposase
VHGAFEPATGKATVILSPSRDSLSHLQLVEKIPEVFPAKQWLLIEDNLSIHKSRDVKTAFLAWPEIRVQFLPRYASWLNLIEPWWKQLKALALKGRRFETKEELCEAIEQALEYWNANRKPYIWRKIPDDLPTKILGSYGTSILKC